MPKTQKIVPKVKAPMLACTMAVIDIVPPIDFSQLISLEKLLRKVPNLQVIGRGGSDDGRSWAEVECSEPIPIVMILKQMSPVKEVAAHSNHVIIALNEKQRV